MGRDDNNRQYDISLIFTGGILVAGFLLQILTGDFNIGVLKFPVNLMSGFIIILTAAGLTFYHDTRFYKWFAGVPFSVTLCGALLALCLIMGIIPQTDYIGARTANDILYKAGLLNITRSWPFVLVYLFILLNLACVTARRLVNFKPRDYGFYFNHLGLWIILFAAGAGSADTGTYTAKIKKGESAHLGTDKNNAAVHLPFNIHLNDFIVEEYHPGLVIVDENFIKILPEKKPEIMPGGEPGTKGKLLNWNIEIDEYLPRSVRDANGILKPVEMPGAAEAALITAVEKNTGKLVRGWVYRGNSMQSPSALRLEGTGWLVMKEPEPKKFISDVEITLPEGEAVSAQIEVNKPLRFGKWMLYQSGYDRAAGRNSEYTVLMAVYDPWINLVYTGIFLLAAGSVAMLRQGSKKHRKR